LRRYFAYTDKNNPLSKNALQLYLLLISVQFIINMSEDIQAFLDSKKPEGEE
jgi:hypothetical protein